jgi:hypothetical protein
MKKIFLFGIGVMFVATTVISFSEASRDAYHSYLYQTTRRFSRTPSTLKVRPYSTKKYSRDEKSFVQESENKNDFRKFKNLRESNYGKTYSNTQVMKTRANRHSTNRITPVWTNPLQSRGSFVVKKIEAVTMKFETYENDTFSVQIPKGWTPDSNIEEKHIFTSPNSDYTISIKKYEPEACEDSLSFFTCAISISKTESRLAANGRGKMLNTSRIVRQTNFSDTVLNERVQTRIFTESFSAKCLDNQETFINRFIVADLDEDVYLIETKTNVLNASKYIGISEKIFDSFRIYPLQ